MLRLFVAFEVPEAQRLALDAVLGPLRATLPPIRWASPQTWHVTVKFLGAVGEERLPEIRSVVAAAASGGAGPPGSSGSPAGPRCRLTDLGAFPNAARARVLWAGVGDPDGALSGLAGRLDEGFTAVGFAPEAREWRPHLTLARLKVAMPVDAGLARAGVAVPDEPFTVDEVVLFRSHLRPSGPAYEALERFPM